MTVLFDAWWNMLSSWWPDWAEGVSYDEVDAFLYGGSDLNGLLRSISSFTFPDILYFVGCILIVVLLLVGLFALFKWMFTLVWRLFKID